MNDTGSLALGIAARAAVRADRRHRQRLLSSAYVGINSLIVTLGTLFIMRGGVYLYTGQRRSPTTSMLDSFYPARPTDGCSASSPIRR